jgi:hypothetical protein
MIEIIPARLSPNGDFVTIAPMMMKIARIIKQISVLVNIQFLL